MVIEEERLDRLEARLHDAKALTPDLVTELISGACPRIAGLGASAQERVVRLTESGAHADAALTLIELELPQWKLRRLECDDGEWHCTLSKQPWLPLGFDKTVEATHRILPLAIVMALVQARHFGFTSSTTSRVPQVKSATIYSVSCDNYS